MSWKKIARQKYLQTYTADFKVVDTRILKTSSDIPYALEVELLGPNFTRLSHRVYSDFKTEYWKWED